MRTMIGSLKLLTWSMVALLPLAALAAPGSDLRLVDAAKAQDKEAVRSLLAQHVDVNAAQGDGTTALIWAAHWNDLAMADLLIRTAAHVNASNDYGVTALWEACNNSSGPMVEKLLKAGGNASAALETGETPLMTCARTGSLEGVNLLLAHGANVNAKETRREQTALMWAVAEKHAEIASVLIGHGADVHARTKHIVLPAAKKAGYNTFEGSYEGDYREAAKGGFTALMFAAERGDVESGQILLAAGADVNDATPEGSTALVVASANGQDEFGKFLLDKGANPNAADNNGMTALHYAVLRGLSMIRAVSYHPYIAYLYRPNMPELAKALLAHGANPNARLVGSPELPYFVFGVDPIGATPFLLAATTDDLEIMRAMIATGADGRIATEEGMTSLMAAQIVDRSVGGTTTGRADAGSKQQEMRTNEAVKLTVEAGADVNAANALGQTALHFAANRGLNQVIQFLVDKGAKVDAKDKYGQTPLNIAAGVRPPGLDARGMARLGGTPSGRGNKSTADLLVKLGAKPLLPAAPAKRAAAAAE